MTIGWLKSKLEVEFQYDGRSFSETWSSYISAVEWDIFTKFGTLGHPGLLRTCAQPNRNRKLIRDVNGRHLENFNDVITVLPMVRFTWNLVRWRKMRCRWRSIGLKSKPEVEFQYGGRFCSKPEVVVLTQPWNDISLQGLVQLQIVTFWGHAHYQAGTGSWFATSTAAILKTLITWITMSPMVQFTKSRNQK